MGELIRFLGVPDTDTSGKRTFPDPDNPITVEIDPRELAQAFLQAGFTNEDPAIEGMGMDILVTQYGQTKAQRIRDDARIRFDLFRQNPSSQTEQPEAPHLRLYK